MPAKKNPKQQQAVSEDDEIAQMTQMMQQALADQAGGNKQEKKLQQKQMEKFVKEIEQQRAQYIREQIMHQQIEEYSIKQEILVANRTQTPMPGPALESHHSTWSQVAPGKWIRCEQFTPQYMEAVMKMFGEELPEPYSVFTYEHFLSGWPCLGILLFGFDGEKAPETPTAGGDLIGAIVSRVTWNPRRLNFRGYIAMLAVRPSWRGHRLGQRLVKISVEVMKKLKASEVVLETPIHNERAIKLYTDMGFAKTKFLTRYYLDGSDAFRLKLWFGAPQQ